jgi:hypothetical protein
MAKIVLHYPTLEEKLEQAGLTQDEFEWCCILCTHSTYLSAGVQKRVEEKLFRVAYLSIRPAMESALKVIWKVIKVKGHAPDNVEKLVLGIEGVYANHNLFSVQMKYKDKFGYSAYRKVNGWAHADMNMWRLYKNGEEINRVVTPMKNMVAQAQLFLQHFDPTLVTEHKYWSTKFE